MATSDEAGPSGQGEQDQEYGGDLPALVAHQGVPDCRLLSAQTEGRSDEGKTYLLYQRYGRQFKRGNERLLTGPLVGLQIKPVQKQTRAGQRTRFKAIVVIGDSEGHVGLGIKTSKEVATAIRAAIIIAKLSVLPIRRGYWGTSLGDPHSLPTKESGKCGSVTVRVSPLMNERLHKLGWCANRSITSSSLHRVVPASSLPRPSSVSSNSPASKTSTLPPPARQRPSRTHSRLRS